MNFFGLFSLCMVFVGTVVGAGFASGLEIWTFFGKYGIFGFGGVVLTSLVISICGAGIMTGLYRGDFKTYGEFCRLVSGKRSGKFFSFLGVAFMYCSFCIMLSGSGALFSQEFGKSYLYGVSAMAFICFLIFIFGANGLTAVNCLLTPLMLIGITLLGFFSLLSHSKSVFFTFSDLLTVSSSLISALIYVSYNLLSVPSVIIPFKKCIFSKKQAVSTGLCGGILLAICSLLMYICSLSENFGLCELPAVALALKHGRFFGTFYGITVYFSMLTTAVGNGFGFIESVCENLPGYSRRVIAFLLCASSSLIALLGFGTLVNKLYTVIGYGALLLTLLLVFYSLKQLKK